MSHTIIITARTHTHSLYLYTSSTILFFFLFSPLLLDNLRNQEEEEEEERCLFILLVIVLYTQVNWRVREETEGKAGGGGQSTQQ